MLLQATCLRTTTYLTFLLSAGLSNLWAQERPSSAEPETITFPSADGLVLTADLYAPHAKTAPFIVLFHQARWSRGEYREIAPKLNALGFNCLAVDQRSGGEVNGVENESYKAAREAGTGTEYLDAEQDLIATAKYARANLAAGKLILWGSSYSASLALVVVGMHDGIADGVMSFAPGDYFDRFGKPKGYVTEAAKRIDVPVFITSARQEQPMWQGIFDAIPGTTKSSFVPETEGNHGARALFERFEDHEVYWEAVREFLAQFRDVS